MSFALEGDDRAVEGVDRPARLFGCGGGGGDVDEGDGIPEAEGFEDGAGLGVAFDGVKWAHAGAAAGAAEGVAAQMAG